MNTHMNFRSYRFLISPRIVLAAVVITTLIDAEQYTQAEEKSPSARWEPTIQKFEEQDQENLPPKNAILFVGSSSIRLWKLPKSFPDRQVINRGFGGSEVADSVHFADRIILKHEPRIVLLYAGDNDVAKGKDANRVHSDFKKFVQVVHKKLPRTKIVYICIKPSIARWKLADKMAAANKLIAADCEKSPLLTYADIWTPMLGDDGTPRKELFAKDGLHLNETGYEVWSKVIRPLLK